MMRKNISKLLLIFSMLTLAAGVLHAQELITLFPLENYHQNITTWINPNDPDYNKPLLTTDKQQQRRAEFYNRLFGKLSPWDATYLSPIFHQVAPDDLRSIEQLIINNFNNQKQKSDDIGYGENFRAYSPQWIESITKNINLAQFKNISYQAKNRAIATENLHARALPTDDPLFLSYQLAGQGYPFDILQLSSIWVGTPIYILGETRDHAWALVLTNDFVGWVKSNGIARVSNAFVNQWQTVAQKNLAAITHTQTSIVDENGNFLTYAYVGSVFPKKNKLLFPVADNTHHAVIKYVNVAANNFALIPLTTTPHHFADIIATLIGRPYGWGNMYFYNDCSAELKNLFTPFGIWLQRHSSKQVESGKIVDMSHATPENRLSYLMANGQKFMTLIYIGGHIVMYLGNFPNPNDASHALMAMTYQNSWGLIPKPSTRRAILGKALFLPLLLQFPEDKELSSQAAKTFFQISYLNEMPSLKTEPLNLRTLMSP